jgi:hypothetical protein
MAGFPHFLVYIQYQDMYNSKIFRKENPMPVSAKQLIFSNWIYVNTLDKNLGFLLISATIDNPNINAQGFLPEGEELKAS